MLGKELKCDDDERDCVVRAGETSDGDGLEHGGACKLECRTCDDANACGCVCIGGSVGEQRYLEMKGVARHACTG